MCLIFMWDFFFKHCWPCTVSEENSSMNCQSVGVTWTRDADGQYMLISQGTRLDLKLSKVRK